MSVSIQDWANTGLPLARTFVALGACAGGASADTIAEASSQDVREVHVHLKEFLLHHGFAIYCTDGMYALTQSGLAQLDGDASDSRRDRDDQAGLAIPVRPLKIRRTTGMPSNIVASSRKRAASG